MDSRNIKRMIRRKRVRLSPGFKILHYLPLLPLFWVSLVLISLISQFDKSGSYGNFTYTEGIMPFAPPLIIFSFLLYRYQRAKLGMTEVLINLKRGEFARVIDYMKQTCNWDIQTQKGGLLTAHKRAPKTLGFEEIITVIRSRNTILINSRSNPVRWISFISFGRNIRNTSDFVRAMDTCCQESPKMSLFKWNGDISPFATVMYRIVAGAICLGSVGLALWLIIVNDEWIGWLAGWGIISFVLFVIDTDLGEALVRYRASKHYGKERFRNDLS